MLPLSGAWVDAMQWSSPGPKLFLVVLQSESNRCGATYI